MSVLTSFTAFSSLLVVGLAIAQSSVTAPLPALRATSEISQLVNQQENGRGSNSYRGSGRREIMASQVSSLPLVKI